MKKKIILSVVILVLVSFCLSEAKDRHKNKHHKHHKDSVICMSWEDKTSGAYWVGYPTGPGRWDAGTSSWVAEWGDLEAYTVMIDVTGSWFNDYSPVKVRITFTGDATTVQLFLIDSNGNEIVGNNTVSSGDEIPIVFGSYDIAKLLTARNETYSITKIEFLAPLLNGVYKFDTASYCGVLMSDISKIDGVDK